MSEHQNYFEYLRTRSFKSFLYRNHFLYPKLIKHLPGYTLDLGCGIGDFLRFNKGAVGVDINSECVKYCLSEGLNAVRMEIDQLPFKASEFDSLIMDNILEHIENPNRILSEVYRVLNQSGRLIIGVPGRNGYKVDPDHKVFYDEKSLSSKLIEFGFSHVETFYTPFQSRVLDRFMRQYCMYCLFQKSSS